MGGKRKLKSVHNVRMFQQKMSETPQPIKVAGGDLLWKATGGLALLIALGIIAAQLQQASIPQTDMPLAPFASSSATRAITHSFSPYAPGESIPEMLQKKLDRRFERAKNVTEAICETLLTEHRLTDYSTNASSEQLDAAVLALREIIDDLIAERHARFLQTFQAREHAHEFSLLGQVFNCGFDAEYYPQVMEAMQAPVNEYREYLGSLLRLHVNAAVVTFMKGGHSRELAYFSALEMVRTLEKKKMDVPSISIVNMNDKNGKTLQSIVRISPKRNGFVHDDQTHYCGTGSPGMQGPSFFSQPDKHPCYPQVVSAEKTIEVGIYPKITVQEYHEDIVSFCSRHRAHFLYEPYHIPEEAKIKLRNLQETFHTLSQVEQSGDLGYRL